jgi:hypothetical protein
VDEKVLSLLGQLTSASSMEKMGQIEGLIKKYGFAEGTANELVPVLCKFIMGNMDNHQDALAFIAHVIDAAREAGPQMEKLLSENVETIASLLNKGSE